MLFKFEANRECYTYDNVTNKILELQYEREGAQERLDELTTYDGIKIYLELTTRCNLKCRYCYLANEGYAIGPDLSIDEKFEHIIVTLEKLIKTYRNAHIIFYGGEPLIERDLISRLVGRVDEYIINGNHNITYGITTNGTLLNDETISYMCDKGFAVTISMDGSKETMLINRGLSTNAKLEKYLTRLAKHANPALIIATLTAHSIGNAATDIDYLLELPVKSLKFISCDTNRDDCLLTTKQVERFCETLGSKVDALIDNGMYDQLSKLEDIIMAMKIIDSGIPQKYACGYGRDVFAISQDGTLYPCPCFMNIPQYKLSHAIAQNPQRHNILICDNCIARHTCCGGCHYSYYVGQSVNRENMAAKCNLMKAFALLAIKIYLRMYVN